MTLKLVQTVKTPYTKEQFVEAAVFAWHDLWKTIPKKQSIGIFLAQTMIETGGSAVYGNNVGNKKVPLNSVLIDKIVTYHQLPNTWEIIAGKKVYFQPPNRQTWFLSYPSLREGIQDHLTFVKSGRYSNAWQYVLSGDVAGYANALKARGYYTAAASDYIKGMNLFYFPYMRSAMYEQAIAKLQAAMLTPVDPILIIDQDDGDLLIDLEDNANIDLIKETKQYIKVSKKLARPWYQDIYGIFSNLFKKK